jgi:uncharacterized protein YbbK (DUF523 family)
MCLIIAKFSLLLDFGYNVGMKLCSACLLGINCKYSGDAKINEKAVELAKKEVLIPVCPEQLGGLDTPREACEQKDGKVFTKTGKEMTYQFVNGANEVLKIAKLFGIKEAILKQRSPSCGSGKIYDGNFNGTVITGDGVTSQLLKKNGIKIISEEDL